MPLRTRFFSGSEPDVTLGKFSADLKLRASMLTQMRGAAAPSPYLRNEPAKSEGLANASGEEKEKAKGRFALPRICHTCARKCANFDRKTIWRYTNCM
jgi:hypothetical protein